MSSQAAGLFPDDFDQNTLAAVAIKFAIKNLFPGSEIQPAAGNSHNHLSSHNLSFEMCIGIIFKPVMSVL